MEGELENQMGTSAPVAGQQAVPAQQATRQQHQPIVAGRTNNASGIVIPQALRQKLHNAINTVGGLPNNNPDAATVNQMGSKYDLHRAVDKTRLYTGTAVPDVIKAHLDTQGMKAITLGNNVYVSGEVNLGSLRGATLLAHESLHVAQWNKFGNVGFAARYVGSTVEEFFKGGLSPQSAYRNNFYENEAYNYDDELRKNNLLWL